MLALDHLIFAVLNESSRLKFPGTPKLLSIPGGTHQQWGTYNYLSHLSNHCYLEWLSLFDYQQAESSENPLIQQVASQLAKETEGLFQIALRTEKMNDFLTYYKDQEVAYLGPFEGSRKKADGSVLAWRMLFPVHPGPNQILPFLIEWNENPPQPAEDEFINKKKLQTLQWGVENPDLEKELWMKVFNLPVPAKKEPFTWNLENTELCLVYGKNIEYKIK